MLKESSHRNDWPRGRVVSANADRNRFVQHVKLLMGKKDDPYAENRTLNRSVNKIVLLHESEEAA